MAKNYLTLRKETGLDIRTVCTEEENKQFTELVNNGQTLPDNLKEMYRMNNLIYFERTKNAPSEQEQLYILMRISKDIHFIRNVVQIGLIIAIIAGILFMFH